MKTKEPKSMTEIHTIREELYSETQGMSMHEMMALISKEAETFKSKHNIKLKTLKKKFEPAGV